MNEAFGAVQELQQAVRSSSLWLNSFVFFSWRSSFFQRARGGEERGSDDGVGLLQGERADGCAEEVDDDREGDDDGEADDDVQAEADDDEQAESNDDEATEGDDAEETKNRNDKASAPGKGVSIGTAKLTKKLIL